MATMSGGAQAVSQALCTGLRNLPQISNQHLVNSSGDPDEPDPPDVYLRVGGTFRYKKEICYVIVIHTDNGASNEIMELPPLGNNAHFKLNGFLDAHG